MRQETNNEIDLLLRRLGRRHGANVPDTDHLDADELSSYAENALPAAARARYTEHLAECSRCRELVVQLSSAVGVVAAEETARASVPSGIRKFLASLFSPMVLRYAVPAMGLIIVAVIGVVVLRSRQGESLVAQLERPAQPQPAAVPSNQSQTPASSYDAAVPDQQKSQSPAGTAGKHAATTKEEQQPAPPPNAPPTVSITAETKPAEPLQKAPDRAAANEAPAPAAPKPSATPDEMRVEIEGRKQNEQTRGVADSKGERERNSAFIAEDKKTDDLAAARSASAKSKRKAPSTGGTLTTLQAAEQEEKDRDSSETRSVAGRTFRKQRGVWVDTAYGGSETTNISRGSEQYRALVADEPAIKTIAEQLDGPIIVVWKGRAYRIR